MKLIKLEKPNCRNCDMLEAYLESENVDYESVNVMSNPDVASKYKVMSVPVLILEDSQGEEVERVSGYSHGRSDEVDNLLDKAGYDV